MSTIVSVLEETEAQVLSVSPETTVLAAVEEMIRHHARALLVADDHGPIGMLSVRDVLSRVVLPGRDATATHVADVMTRDVVSVPVAVDPSEALALMAERHVHYLPVVESDTVVGVVTLDDLVRWASHARDSELETLKEYVYGPYSR